MNSRVLIPLMPLLLGCTITLADDESAEDSTTGDGDGDPSTGDGDGDTATTGDGDGDGDGDGEPGDGDGEPVEQWCGLDEGPDQPWFEVQQAGVVLEAGSDLAVECGFQGSFMIEMDPRFGGFIPESDSVPFHVVLDVEDYNIGPNGHFAEQDVAIYAACCDDDNGYGYCYYLTTTFQMFPPDAIADLSVLHGLPAQLTVTMDSPGDPVEQVLDVQMWALEQDMNWEFCSYYPDTEPLPVDGLPIPE